MRHSRSVVLAFLALLASHGGGSAAEPPPTIVVEAVYPGANARVVADTVAAPIEQQVNGVEKIRRMWSRCGEDGSYTLTIEFARGTDLDLSQVLVQNRVALAAPVLPQLVQMRGLRILKKPAGILAILPLLSPDGRYDNLSLGNYARRQLVLELARVSGVGDVRVVGQREYIIRVRAEKAKLLRWGVTAADLVKALEGQNLQVEAGQPPRGEQGAWLTITPKGRGINPEELGDIVVKAKGPDSPRIRLKTVAHIELGAAGPESNASLDGKPAVGLVVYLAQKARPAKVKAALKERLSKLREEFPKGLDFGPVFDFTSNLEAPDKKDVPDYLLADVALPDGASFERVFNVADHCASLLRKTPGVGRVLTLAGEDPFDCASDRAWIFASLAPAEKGRDGKEQILKEARRRLREVRGAHVGLRDLTLGACPLEFLVSGPDPARVKEMARKLAERLRKTTAVTDLRGSAEERKKGLDIQIDADKAAKMGVKVGDITNTLQTYFGSFSARGAGPARTYRYNLSGDLETRAKDLRQLFIRNGEGKMVPLGGLISLSVREADPFVYRLDSRRAERITADLAPGVSPATARKVCDKAAEEIRKGLKLRASYRLSWLRPAD